MGLETTIVKIWLQAQETQVLWRNICLIHIGCDQACGEKGGLRAAENGSL